MKKLWNIYKQTLIKLNIRTEPTKLLRHTFQLGQLDGIGKEVRGQQHMEEIKEILTGYCIHQLTIQNDTDARTERAIRDRDEPRLARAIQQRSSSSIGMTRQFTGHVASGVGHMANGAYSELLAVLRGV